MSRVLLVSHFQFHDHKSSSFHLSSLLQHYDDDDDNGARRRIRRRTLVTKLKRHYPALTAAASLSGSDAADYSEQLEERRKKRIAGIDQDELLDPTHLADSDACFCEFRGVHLHYKVCEYPADLANVTDDSSASGQQMSIPMILLHGFGASVYSWSRVMKPLTQLICAKVLAFDRPAFGFTSRPFPPFAKPLNPYSMMFSVLATLHFIDSLAADKVILVGHSAGSLVAVNSYFEAPECVAALILVAPAIFAPLIVNKEKTTDNLGDRSKFLWKPIVMIPDIFKFIVQPIVLSAILRSAVGLLLVRTAINAFGIAAVRNSWCDPNKVTEHVLEGYTKVLIVTGDRDRIVPCWNAKRLSQAIPGSSLEVINNCGHLPHEEKVDEFISVVDKFLQTALATPPPFMQASREC